MVVCVGGGVGGRASRVQGGAGQGRGGEKIKPRGGATNNRIDDKTRGGMFKINCVAFGYPTPEYFAG